MSELIDVIGHVPEPLLMRTGEPFAFTFSFPTTIDNSTWTCKMKLLNCDLSEAIEFPNAKFSKPTASKLLFSLAPNDFTQLKAGEYLFKLRIQTGTETERTWIDGKIILKLY